MTIFHRMYRLVYSADPKWLSETGRHRKKTSVVSERSIRGLVSLLICACVYKGGGCRQTGSRGLQNRTGHHNSSARSLATDRQTGLNADGSLIGICHQQPTKSIYLWGKPSPILTLKQIRIQHTHYQAQYTHIWCVFDSSLSSVLPCLSAWLTLSCIRFNIFHTLWVLGRKKNTTTNNINSLSDCLALVSLCPSILSFVRTFLLTNLNCKVGAVAKSQEQGGE